MNNIVVFVFKSVLLMLKNIAFFLTFLERKETLGINGKGESTFSWFQGVDGLNFKICEVKILSNWLSSSNTETYIKK